MALLGGEDDAPAPCSASHCSIPLLDRAGERDDRAGRVEGVPDQGDQVTSDLPPLPFTASGSVASKACQTRSGVARAAGS